MELLTEAMTAFAAAVEAIERERKEETAAPEDLFVGALIQVSDDPWYDSVGKREYLSGIAGDTGEIIDGPDNAGDWKVSFGAHTDDFWINGKCLFIL